MGRPQGSRNAGYVDKRRALAEKIADAMLDRPAGRPSLRDLADFAEVSVSTLRHYFDHRDGVIAAALEVLGGRAQPFLNRAASPSSTDPPAAVHAFIRGLVDAWDRYAVASLHTIGLAEGLDHAEVGPAYVRQVLEPTLDAAERLLDALGPEHALRSPTRVAALALVAPVLAALQHQHGLGGDEVRPLELPGFVEAHVACFCEGYLTTSSAA